MFVIGLDLGYGTVTRAFGHSGGGAPRYDTWTSGAMLARKDIINPFGGSLGRKVTVGNDEWYVGIDPELVDGSEILHDHYVGSDIWKAHFVAGIAVGEPVIHRLTLGLPVDEWLDPARRSQLIEHSEALAGSSGIRVDDIEVVPQPLGAYVEANSRQSGRLIDQATLVIDPGRYSLDWALFINGRLSNDGTGSDHRGSMSRLVEGIQGEIFERFAVRVSEGRIRNALARGSAKIKMRGEEKDCSAAIEAAASNVIPDALDRVKSTLRVKEDLDAVVLAGGGAEFYEAYLSRVFPASMVSVAKKPLQANAGGFWYYGCRNK